MRSLFRKPNSPAQRESADLPPSDGGCDAREPLLLVDNTVDTYSTNGTSTPVHAESGPERESTDGCQTPEPDVEWVTTEYMNKNSIFTYFAEHGLGVKAFNDNWNSAATGADFRNGHPVYIDLVVRSLVKLSISGDTPSFRKWYHRLHDTWLDLKETITKQGAYPPG
jgi:hypothetical protein